MPPSHRAKFFLHAYVVANRARLGEFSRDDFCRLAELAKGLSGQEPGGNQMKFATIRFIENAPKDLVAEGEKFADAVQQYCGGLEAELKEYDWQRRADLQ
jgi:hypothetical protein